MDKPNQRERTDEERTVDLVLGVPMGAYLPSVNQMRSALQYLEKKGFDGPKAYARWEKKRPKTWAQVPTYAELMATE